MIRMMRAIASSVDQRVRGAAVIIHIAAVRALNSTRYRELIRRQYANSADYDIGGLLGSVLREYGADEARMGIANEGANFRITDDPNTMPRMLLLVEGRDIGARHAVHHAISHLEYRHIEPEFTSRRGHFEPDVTAADDDQAFPRSQIDSDPLDVGDRAQEMHSAKISSGGDQHAWAAARC